MSKKITSREQSSQVTGGDRPKVFVIGFSKTATTTIHKFFANSGYNSVHWDLADGRFLAGVVVTNVLSGRPILATIDDFDVYSEFSYADGKLYLEANYFFEELYGEYPDAYFLLNTRDTDSWVASRKRHFGRNIKARGALHERIGRAYGVSEVETEQIWRSYKPAFHKRVTDFFSSRKDARFLEFDIVNDSVEQLITWLKPHYSLAPELWSAENVTAEQEKIRRLQRNPFARLLRKLAR